MTAGKVLITGAGGYLGRRLARRYLEGTDRDLILWLRAKDAAEAASKREALAAHYLPWEGRVQFAFGDLSQEEPFQGIDAASVGTILHGAAIIRFNVEKEDARRTNLEGTGKMLAFASRCSKLERLGLISSVYSSGLRAGAVEERLFDGQDGFCNHYEWSKWESEAALTSRYSHLPWSILRVATVIADDESGKVSQYNAVHNTLMLFHYGLLSLIPGGKDVPLYFVTGAFAADAIAAAMGSATPAATASGAGSSASSTGAGRIYHISHRREESITLGGFIEAAFDQFGEDEAFKARRLLKPLFADQKSFDILVEGMKSFGGGVVNDSLASVTPFARQLFVAKDTQNDTLRAAFPGYRSPDPVAQIRATCGYLTRTKWGRLPDTEAQA